METAASARRQLLDEEGAEQDRETVEYFTKAKDVGVAVAKGAAEMHPANDLSEVASGETISGEKSSRGSRWMAAIGLILVPLDKVKDAIKTVRNVKKIVNKAGDARDLSKGTGTAVDALKKGAREAAAENAGRTGKQARLREIADDPNVSTADRGWIKQEKNSIERGQRDTIRNPPGKDLAHERGREAAKGYSYEQSNLQDRDLHKIQHKFDDFGRANKERPLRPDEP